METKEFTIRRDGDRDLRFKGAELAAVSSFYHQGPMNTRWCELTLYKTEGNKYVVADVNRTRWEGEHDTHSATVCETADDVYAALTDDTEEYGGGVTLNGLAKELLEEAAQEDEGFKDLTLEDID